MGALTRAIGSAASRLTRSSRLTILVYHRVLPEPDFLRPREIDAAGFLTQMESLAEDFNVLPFGTAARLLEENRLPPRAVSITFDDGYADNEAVALPVLRRCGLPATFFIATGFVDGGRMWNDSIVEAVRVADAEALDLRQEGLGDYSAIPESRRCEIVAEMISRLKYLPADRREELVGRIVMRVDKTLPDDLMMTSAQVRKLVSAGMEIGAHTVNHPILGDLDDSAARREIEQSRDAIAAIAGSPVEVFAYPNGKPGTDYTRRDVDIVRSAGFRAAVSTALGAAAPGADPLQLPRLAPWSRNRRGFAFRLIRNYGRANPATA